MTNWDYVKVEHVKTWLLSSSFANFQWFSSWFSFFTSFFFYFNPYCLRGPWPIDTCRVLCFPLGFFWKVKNIVSVLFTVWNLQTAFPLKPKFAWVPQVKLPVKYLWYSGKFTCARRQCACVLREVLAASKQVNLPVITGKLHVTQVNCARDLFTCELHVKLPAFAGNFARASFTVYAEISM